MKRLRDIRCFMLDMDGTFYLGHRLLPGALRFMDYLAQTGREAVFVTNNSSNSAAYYAEKLTTLGWRAKPEDILTAGQATDYYLRAKQEQVKVFHVGTPALAEREEKKTEIASCCPCMLFVQPPKPAAATWKSTG